LTFEIYGEGPEIFAQVQINQAMKAKSRIEQKREEKADKREVKV
jgi:hypothetical protein